MVELPYNSIDHIVLDDSLGGDLIKLFSKHRKLFSTMNEFTEYYVPEYFLQKNQGFNGLQINKIIDAELHNYEVLNKYIKRTNVQ